MIFKYKVILISIYNIYTDIMEKEYTIIYYYSNNNIAYYIEHNDDTNELKTMDFRDLSKPENKLKCYGSFENYLKTHKSLIQFKKDMIQWVEEIKSVEIKTALKKIEGKEKKIRKRFNLDYYQYFNHNDAAILEFKKHYGKDNMEKIEPVDKEEFYIHKRTRNSGLVIVNDDYCNTPIQCYSYDYPRFYVHELLCMTVPLKRGCKKIFLETEINYDKL